MKKTPKIVIASDSFKGTLSQEEICALGVRTVNRLFPGAECVCVPIADGGEGSVDCFLAAAGGERVRVPAVRDCTGAERAADYAILPDGKTAVIEVAAAAGITLCGEEKQPMTASTYGVGQQIAHAVAKGCSEIILCLGGSATTDAGCGLAAALGVEFYDKNGKKFIPAGGTLKDVCRIGGRPALGGARLRALCDTSAPLWGVRGAAYVYAPQKGATPEQVRLLDDGLCRVGGLMNDYCAANYGACDLSQMPGGGAAGGIGACAVALLGGSLCPGIAAFLELTQFEEKVRGADLVITGEGKLDSQSLTGKAAVGVARACRKAGVRCVALVGTVGDLPDPAAPAAEGISAIYTTAGDPPRMPRDSAEAQEAYEKALEGLLRGEFCR